MVFESWMCPYCGWLLRFAKGRSDVYTYCDKCHTDMEQLPDHGRD